ncbi:alpha-galactosidase [Sesbania bispinosa]|nr:alpha-galactosidase [Sesbania bispinosa]
MISSARSTQRMTRSTRGLLDRLAAEHSEKSCTSNVVKPDRSGQRIDYAIEPPMISSARSTQRMTRSTRGLLDRLAAEHSENPVKIQKSQSEIRTRITCAENEVLNHCATNLFDSIYACFNIHSLLLSL